jgi:hypothetical protein
MCIPFYYKIRWCQQKITRTKQTPAAINYFIIYAFPKFRPAIECSLYKSDVLKLDGGQ